MFVDPSSFLEMNDVEIRLGFLSCLLFHKGVNVDFQEH